MTADANSVFIGNATAIVLDALKNALTGAYDNSATVGWALKTAAGSSLATGSLSYVASSNGKYTGQIAASATTGLTIDTEYFLEVTVTSGGSQAGFWRLPMVAAYRTTC